MTAHEIKLVKQSWRLLRNINPNLIGDTFFGKLFSIKPGLRRLFPQDMHIHNHNLVDIINSFVAGLDSQKDSCETSEEIKRRVAQMSDGISLKYYPAAEKALLWTLEKGLGSDFTPEVLNAWTHSLQLLKPKAIA